MEPTEVVVGRQLHPAQARAIDRAERAAEWLEWLQAEVEVKASRYRTPDQAVVPEETPIPEGSEVWQRRQTEEKSAGAAACG